MSYMENKDYGEIFCQAVDEIVGQRLEAVKFDQTILCTIIDDSWRDTGKYIVSNNGGTTKFEAFSENTDYRNNNNVYVQIPSGDWDQQKIIIGKKTDKADESYIYKKPFSSLVDITGNLIAGNIERKVTGLIANNGIVKTESGKVSADQGLKEYVIDLWTYNVAKSEAICKEEGVAQSGYTRLGIQAGFQSWLNTFYTSTGNDSIDSVPRTVIQGKYGLRLIITPKRESVVSVAEDEENFKSANYILELNTDDMNGNPYDFASFYTQQKLFDISSIGEIEQMKLQFYETTGSFVDSEGYYISDTDFLGNSITPNLYVNDVYISLGYDVDEFDTEMVQIYTLDPTTYSRTADPATNNHKKLQLRWIHKLDDDTYKSITSADDIGSYEVRWYRYQLGAASADEYSGVYWKYLSIQTSDANVIKDPDWEFYNINNKDVEFFRYPGYFYSWAIPDTTLQQEQYKAIILYNGKPYRSNVITFQNKDEVVSAPTVDAVQALSINCEDGTYGNYRIYNNGNSLLDFSQSSVKRQWKAYFKSALEEADENNPDCELTEAEQIEWIIPLTKTMIVLDNLPDSDTFDEDNNPYYSYDYDASGQKIRIHIFNYGNPNRGYDISGSNTLTYRIKGYYSQTYSDNTIQCKIIKDKITYTATKEMTFGVAGTTGTDCTFILDFDNGVTAVTDIKDDFVTVTARLYDYENNEIDISNETIEWTWKTQNDKPLFAIGNKDKNGNAFFCYQREIKRTNNILPEETKANFSILQATLKSWGNYELKAYLPIPLKKEKSYNYISGTTQIIYNSNGELIDYFKNPYILYKNAMAKNNIYWDIYNNIYEETENGFTPKITLSKNKEYYLTPLSFYVENSCEKVCVIARDGDENVLWVQPILIITNRYPSAMINEWDGNLDVGTLDPGTILAPRLVAGSKDKDNLFSGVMLGDWTPTNSSSDLTEGTGLFGYYKGEQSYGFKDDGTAFIGKKGLGRIKFDGISGTIKSAGYEDGSGMCIDLTNNLIDAKKFKQNSNGNQLADSVSVFKLSDKDPFLTITNPKANTNGEYKTLMQVGGSKYFLQSANYKNELTNTTNISYVILGAAYNSYTYNRWKNLYTTLYYKKNNNYYQSFSYTSGQTLYYQTTTIESSATRLGSYFDLNNGELIINRGYINGDVILQPDEGIKYTTYKVESNSYTYGSSSYESSNTYYYVKTDGEAAIPQSSLVNILAEIYSNLSKTDAAASAADSNAQAAKSIATYASSIAEVAYSASKNAQSAINSLSKYFGIGIGDTGQETITMSTGYGGSVRVGKNVTIYSNTTYGCQVQCDLHVSGTIYPESNTTLYQYIYNIASSLLSSSSSSS